MEFGLTENKLVTKTGRVRVVEPQYEHPFIRRSMERCISCGRCVRVCRDVAGPACYDFTGRGFTMKVDTPYSDSLQLADCITCGRCVTECPTGALTFNQRQLSSFRVDESRCIMCQQCIEVCPVDALQEADQFENARKRWLELVGKGSGLAGGHRMCAGCGAPVVVRQVLMGTSDPVVVGAATGCLEVSTTIYPYTSWKGGFIHTAFENAAATLSGVETAFRALKKKGEIADNVKFIAFGGDGGTYDIGLQSPVRSHGARSPHALRLLRQRGLHEHRLPAFGRYPDRGLDHHQPGRRKESAGKVQNRKNLTELMIAHGLRYVAQASPHDPARPGPQGGQGALDRRCDLPQRPLALPSRLALRRSREHRPRPRSGEHLLLAALRGTRTASTGSPIGRSTSCRSSPGSSARAASPTCSRPGNEETLASHRGLRGQRVGEAPGQVRRAQRGRLAGTPARRTAACCARGRRWQTTTVIATTTTRHNARLGRPHGAAERYGPFVEPGQRR